ncbi:hypothetical protein JA1_002506 [Spathaspora sp. JA1]|nr:hypothetical protein JA1_002506 [Spathaspora sp. JA1]
MTLLSIILKYTTPRVLRVHQWNKFGVENPYFEYVPTNNEQGIVKYYKKISRRIPDGISENDLTILRIVRKRAYRSDFQFSIGSMKFGWASIMKIIPILGTMITFYWSLELLTLCWELDDGFPWNLQLLFILNLIIDFTIGSIPLLGMIFEIGYKANSRNFLILERHLTKVGERNLQLITDKEDEDEYSYELGELRTIREEDEPSEQDFPKPESPPKDEETRPSTSMSVVNQTASNPSTYRTLDLLHPETSSLGSATVSLILTPSYKTTTTSTTTPEEHKMLNTLRKRSKTE